jgi:3-methyl-2-oxobutanoate hydroxymethyltransferase
MAECPRCHEPGRAVSAVTIAQHAPRAAAATARAEGWFLCLTGDECDVVYFQGDSVVSLTEAGTAPFHKSRGADRTVCFCFRHSERDVLDELEREGRSAIQDAISGACRQGRSDCVRANPAGRCCLADVSHIVEAARDSEGPSASCCESPGAQVPGTSAAPAKDDGTTTAATLRAWAAAGSRFPIFTCYDATTARWLARGGARVLLVGDSAAQLVLGMDRDGKASLEYMAAIGTAVRRGAPRAFVMVDYPDDLTGSPEDDLPRIRSLARASGADAIKVEGEAAALRALLAASRLDPIPIVAHLSQIGAHRCCGGRSPVATDDPGLVETLAADILSLAEAGALSVLLLGAHPAVTAAVVQRVAERHRDLPILGCHSGPACPGQVQMLHDLLGLGRTSESSPDLGETISEAARRCIASLATP